VTNVEQQKCTQWVDIRGNPAAVGRGKTANEDLIGLADQVKRGEAIGNVEHLVYRDPNNFRAGELHHHLEHWRYIAKMADGKDNEVLRWIESKVSIEPYFHHFKGTFKGEQFDSDRPPHKVFRNNVSCKPFKEFIQQTLLMRVRNGAISLVGRVGQVKPPHLVLPLTVEPTKPRLCHDARYLNLWMKDMPFSLDRLVDLPRYVQKDTYQTILDDKSGYDHLLLTEESRTYFGIQWGGFYFTYNSLPFGWKISPYVYQSTGLLATNFFRSIGIPCLLYIDDRHNGQLQIVPQEGEYRTLKSKEERNLAAAKSAIFLVAFHLLRLGYYLGLSKSILEPKKVVPYLGFQVDSSREVFHLIPEKRQKFVELIQKTLGSGYVSVKTLQRIVGKCVSFSLAVPAAKLFTREMNGAIAKGLRNGKPIRVSGTLREEIAHWLFLENWDDPLPWRDERHTVVTLATDASEAGWGGKVIAPFKSEISDYWSGEEMSWDIATKEAVAIDRVLNSISNHIRNSRVDVRVDNQAVIHAWNNQGGKSKSLNRAIKQLYWTTTGLNILLHLSYIPTRENPADEPSRRLSRLDCTIALELWERIQDIFGGDEGHTCDLMALDSNSMTDRQGKPLPHFTPYASPASLRVNLFAQDLGRFGDTLQRPYIFPPHNLVGPVLRFLKHYKQSCTVVALDSYPRSYWWPLLHRYAAKARKMAKSGDPDLLLMPTRQGWSQVTLPADLWVFRITFC